MRILFSSPAKGCRSASGSLAPVDLIFMVDGSWSVANTFRNQLSLVKKVVDSYGGISEGGAHAGVLAITTNPTVKISLRGYNNDAFMTAVSRVSVALLSLLLLQLHSHHISELVILNC